MMFKNLRRNLVRDSILHHGEALQGLYREREALGSGWPDERLRISNLIIEKERKLSNLRAKLHRLND